MSKVSPYLRRAEGRYMHWCPGCNRMHPLPDGWTFNGDVNRPTFTPSFKHTIGQNPDGSFITCRYILTNGVLNFCNDCHHPLSGKPVPLPELPEHATEF